MSLFPPIYLASNSPRRKELLQQIAVDFVVLAVDVDEQVLPGETPEVYVQRVALAKAAAGWQQSKADRPVLAADTSVIVDGQILGKPQDQLQARQMLHMLSGRCHQVLTAVALQTQGQQTCLLQRSEVCFARLSDAEIDWYLTTGEGNDKAGGYAVQGLAAIFIEQIHGSYSGIMGLPLRETARLLEQVNKREQ